MCVFACVCVCLKCLVKYLIHMLIFPWPVFKYVQNHPLQPASANAVVCANLSVVVMHIKDPSLLIGKSIACVGSGFPLSLSEWSFTICLTPYNRK